MTKNCEFYALLLILNRPVHIFTNDLIMILYRILTVVVAFFMLKH